MGKLRVHLVGIDFQYDFCDPKGNLYVPGAEKDVDRVAKMIDRLGSRLDDASFTMDSHHPWHIAHPIYWKDSKGKHPTPFIIITVKDVENGVWTPSIARLYTQSLSYVKALAKNGRYALCIWNPHCLIGSRGAAIAEPVFNSLTNWENEHFGVVNYVTKGSNIYTEHYSAVQADVPQPNDLTTQLNTDLIKTIEESDLVALTGEAANFCCQNTFTDIANNFSDKSAIKKMVLLEDAMSLIPIPDYQQNWDNFLKDMKSRGMQVSNTVDFLS